MFSNPQPPNPAGYEVIYVDWYNMGTLLKFLEKDSLLCKQKLLEFSNMAAKTGQPLAGIILSNNNANPQLLYKKIAEFEKLQFADLRAQPCDKELLSPDMRDDYLKFQAIPWKKASGKIVIATSAITSELKSWAAANYNENHAFAITTPFDISYSVNSIFAIQNDMEAREKLWQMHPQFSARDMFSRKDAVLCISIILLAAALIIAYPAPALAVAFVITSLFYTVTLLFKSILMIIGYFAGKGAEKTSLAIACADSELPIYTILVPLYKEEKTLHKLVAAIENLDYPLSKLDIKLIVEADDEITINAIKTLQPSRIFEMIPVPYSLPRTKPKACNYALRFARGEYVTIYDADDIPEPDQLKKVLYKFQNEPELVCVQARLNYFNRSENILTRMFAIEYSNLFDFMVFALEKLNIPIPLGGTSNHFRIENLRQLYAWDPYNVTEDADLGIRISQQGWRCGMVWSLTNEEAPISVWAWIKQRTRWIKGHMQTYLVHMRKPMQLYKKLGLVGFMGMQFFLGASTLIFIISPIMWLVYGLFIAGIIRLDVNMPVWFDVMLNFSIMALVLGIIVQVAFAIASILRNGWKDMLVYSLLYPCYWILHSVASFRAIWQLVKCPHYWEKTTHGVSRVG